MTPYSVTRYLKDLPRDFGYALVDILDSTQEIVCARLIILNEKILPSRDLDLIEDLDLITDTLANGTACGGTDRTPE
jgi:hypothetical protein